MVVNLSERYSLLNNWIGELRSTEVQTDRMRFRRNLERIGEVIAYEISKSMAWEDREITTPLGISVCKQLKQQPVVMILVTFL